MIRLANNNLADTTGLYKMALDVVEFPEDIAWLDLSFNEIGAVSNDILEFPALKMLYLHGNKIRYGHCYKDFLPPVFIRGRTTYTLSSSIQVMLYRA